MQDNAPSHRFKMTARNLTLRDIRTIKWPAYSPHLNLIEHVWNWIKNYLQEKYFVLRYDVKNIPLDRLQAMIWKTWLAMPDSFILKLYRSWWDRCEAVIQAQGDFTKY
jgi:transposase